MRIGTIEHPRYDQGCLISEIEADFGNVWIELTSNDLCSRRSRIADLQPADLARPENPSPSGWAKESRAFSPQTNRSALLRVQDL